MALHPLYRRGHCNLRSVCNSEIRGNRKHAQETLSGVRKDRLFIELHAHMFEPYLSKIRFLVIESFPAMPSDRATQLFYRHQVENVPNWYSPDIHTQQQIKYEVSTKYNFDTQSNLKQTLTTWFREEYSRDLAADYILLTYTDHRYMVVVVDSDEITSLSVLSGIKSLDMYRLLTLTPIYLNMELFYYNFKVKRYVNWSMGFICNDKTIARYTFNIMRNYVYERPELVAAGWHATYFMTSREISRKLKSFSHSEFSGERYTNIDTIQTKIETGRDLFDRAVYDNVTRYDVNTLPMVLQTFNTQLIASQQRNNTHIQQHNTHTAT